MLRSTTRLASVLASAGLLAALAVPGAAQSRATAPTDPPLSTFVDSAGLVRAVAALSLPELPPRTIPLFLVNFDSTGGVGPVVPLFDPLPAGYGEAVAAAIRAHLKPQPPSRRPLHTHLRVVAGARPQVDNAPFSMEQPVLANRNAIGSLLQKVSESRMDSLPELEYRAMLRFRVLSDGSVDSVKVGSSTGRAWLDREIVRVGRQARFTPATIEGIPINSSVTLPIRLQTPRATARIQ